jgi:hypothetical protein
VLKNIFAQLELRYGLLRETTPKYLSYQYKLYGDIENDDSLAGAAIRKASKKGAKAKWTQIDVNTAASAAALDRAAVVQKLNEWNNSNKIELDQKSVQSVHRVLKPLPKKREEQEPIIDALYKDLVLREQQDLARGDQVIQLITGSQCFALALAKHFGDDLPDGSKECGMCMWCEKHTPVVLQKPPFTTWDEKKFFNVLNAVKDRDDPRFLARIAFGVSSPRISGAKVHQTGVFGSMEDHDFMMLLRAFEKVCEKAGYR